MMSSTHSDRLIRAFRPHRERGVVLVTTLLLLLVMTLIALTMFRSLTVQELIAGNVREKQRALQAAEDAEQYAEIWLSTKGNALNNGTDCSLNTGVVAYTASSSPAICIQALTTLTGTSTTSVPWYNSSSSAELGGAFYPGTVSGSSASCSSCGLLNVTTTAITGNTYYQVPRYYIGLVAQSSYQAMYRIDAWSWAGTQRTATVIESNYVITCSACPL